MIANPERARYEKVWQFPQYRVNSTGERQAMRFLAQAKPERDATVIDFGCGTGRGGLLLALFGNCKVTLVDFASNCLDPEVSAACERQPDRIRFLQADLTQTLPLNAAYGYCTDFMEHVAEADVPAVLRNILSSAQHVYFVIDLEADEGGPALVGEALHLTVRPREWWLERLREAGATVNWHEDFEDALAVYCTSWHDAGEIVKIGRINVPEGIVDAHVRTNILAGWQHLTPWEKQDREVLLLAGGPSMEAQLPEIRKLRAEGAGLVTVNGAYHWALAHDLEPSVQIVLDAREFNARFTRPATAYTKYLIASQCHPSTLEHLPHERTFLWHSALAAENEALVREMTGHYFPVPGGSTVVLRALPLLRMIGLWRIHLFGFDSCVADDGTHHAYRQDENDGEPLLPVSVGGRVFQCAPWMVSQATEFRDLVGFLGDEVECAVHGDGLIAAMIETGAQLEMKEA